MNENRTLIDESLCATKNIQQLNQEYESASLYATSCWTNLRCGSCSPTNNQGFIKNDILSIDEFLLN